MAIIIEQNKKPVNWFNIIMIAVVVAIIFALIYFIFFSCLSKFFFSTCCRVVKKSRKTG